MACHIGALLKIDVFSSEWEKVVTSTSNRVLSIFWGGNEDYSNILRLLASAELFIKCDFYIRYFSILWRSLNNTKNDLVNFQYILSNNSSDKILSHSDYVDAMKHEAMLNAKDSTYVAFVFFPVMSRILSCSI